MTQALVNQLDSKILYLGNLVEAIHQKDIARVYELLDTKRFHEVFKGRQHVDSNAQYAQLVADLHDELATFLAPKVLAFLQQRFPFLVVEPVEGQPAIYHVYMGDWWDHRLIGTLDILRVAIDFDRAALDKLRQTAKLPTGESINDVHIADLRKINQDLTTFMEESVKRQLELSVAEDQLAALEAEKRVFGRRDVRHKWQQNKASIEEKRDLLTAQEAQMPETAEKIAANDTQILLYEKEVTQLRLELEAVLAHFETFDDFMDAVTTLYADFLTQVEEQDAV